MWGRNGEGFIGGGGIELIGVGFGIDDVIGEWIVE